MATKEQIIAQRQIETERYLLSTMPVLYLPLWKTDSGESGDSFISSDGHGHLCTVTNALWRHNGYEFDGAGDLINCGNDTIFDTTQGITIGAWFKADGAGEGGFGRVISKQGAVFSISFSAANQFSCFLRDGTAPTDREVVLTDITYNVWHHVILAYNGALQTVDLDGMQFVDTVSWVGDINTDTSNIKIGNREANDRSWDGLIGEVILHNRGLDPTERQQLYLATEWRYR